MEIVPLTSDNRASWDQFCLSSPDAWFWHTTSWIDWNIAYRPDLKQRSLSFLCKEGSRIMALVPLLMGLEPGGGRPFRVFGFSGNPGPLPALPGGLSTARREKLLDLLFELIEGLAIELGVSHVRFQSDALSVSHLKPEHAPFNETLKRHYVDCSIATQLIDLRQSENQLWDDMRRDHQRNIKKMRGDMEIVFHSGAGLTDEIFDSYRLMHARAAGRVTRPIETFRMMQDWIRGGDGFLAEARLQSGTSVGFEAFHGYKEGVYSLSACNEPGHERLPIRHLLQWEAILWMKRRGYQFYEIGNQQFGVTPHEFPDRKKLYISLFKNGFGGVTVPIFRGERFLDKEFWQEEQRRRVDAFSAGHAWKTKADTEQARKLIRLIDGSGCPQQPQPGETESIPDFVRTLAAQTTRENPEAVQRHRNGSTKAVAFLVGAAMQRAPKGVPPRLVRRAIEEHLEGRRT